MAGIVLMILCVAYTGIQISGLSLYNKECLAENEKCVSALMQDSYDSCGNSVTNFPTTWGICEVHTCQDYQKLLQHIGRKQNPQV